MTVRADAIRILGEAARTDGQVLMAADRLDLYHGPAARLALAAFYSEPVQGVGEGWGARDDGPWQRPACGIAESLLIAGWLP